MKLNQLYILVEARRNPHLNPKISSIQTIINLYKNDPVPSSLFVTFTNVNKLGINPSSQYSTPNGIYCYRLSYVVELLEPEWSRDSLLYARPFPESKVENVIVFRVIDNSKIFNLKDNLTQTTLDKIIEASNSDDIYQNMFSLIIKNNKGTYKGVWRAVYKYIKSNKHFDKHSPRTFNRNDNSTSQVSLEARFALSVFRKLGIDGFIDDGKEIIHENEPNQAVFFNRMVLKIVDHLKDEHNVDLKRGDIPLTTRAEFFDFVKGFYSHNFKDRIYNQYLLKISKWIDQHIDIIYNDVELITAICNHWEALSPFIIKSANKLNDEQKEIICHHLEVRGDFTPEYFNPIRDQIKGQNP